MASRKQVQDLSDAWSREERCRENVKWSLRRREEAREELHRLHQEAVKAELELQRASDRVAELEAAVGVERLGSDV